MVYNRLFYPQPRFNSQARKNFRPQSTNDDTVIAEQSDYVWDPEWSHPAFIIFHKISRVKR